jgi:O-antigen polymerase
MDRWLGLFAGLFLLLGLQQFSFSNKEKISVLLLIVLAVFFESLIGWIQLIVANNNIVLLWWPYNNTRPIGVFQQPNVMASFMATGLLLSGYLVSFPSTAYSSYFKKAMFWLLLSVPVMTVHLLNDLASRTGLLAATLGVLLLLPRLLSPENRRRGMLWLVSLGLGLVFSLNFGNLPGVSYESSGRVVLSLEGPRTVHIPHTIEMIAANPISGYGYGNFERSFLDFTAQAFAIGELAEPGMAGLDHPHNELLFWAAEGGILAFAVLLFAAYQVWRVIFPQGTRHALALIAIFLPIVLHSQLEYPFYVSVAHWVTFIILIYWVDGLKEERRQIHVQQVLLIGVAGILLPLLTTLFMVTTLQSGRLLARFELIPGTDVAELQKMTNPVVWQDLMVLAIRFRLIIHAVATNNPELARAFIDWAPQFLEKYPRPLHYRYLILAYQVVGDTQAGLEVQEKASYLFPGESFELIDIKMLESILTGNPR